MFQQLHLHFCQFQVDIEKANPHSVERNCGENVLHLWSHSLYVLACLLKEVQNNHCSTIHKERCLTITGQNVFQCGFKISVTCSQCIELNALTTDPQGNCMSSGMNNLFFLSVLGV